MCVTFFSRRSGSRSQVLYLMDVHTLVYSPQIDRVSTAQLRCEYMVAPSVNLVVQAELQQSHVSFDLSK